MKKYEPMAGADSPSAIAYQYFDLAINGDRAFKPALGGVFDEGDHVRHSHEALLDARRYDLRAIGGANAVTGLDVRSLRCFPSLGHMGYLLISRVD
jgi:hypothetical protein